MRLLAMTLERFGHFEDRALDLDHPPGGLRFVLGPNEAGKSTLRAAMRMALFGPSGPFTAGWRTADTVFSVHLQTRDGHQAVHRHGSGLPLDGNGEPIGEETLRRWVGVSPESFDQLFCLGHDELRRHGHALLQSDGGLGRVLFGAALGGGAIDDVSTGLRADIEKLFKPRGSKQKIPESLAKLGQIDRQFKERTVTADQWSRQKDRILTLEAGIATLEQQRDALNREKNRLTRIQALAPGRAERARLLDALAGRQAEGAVLESDRLDTLDRLRREERELGVELDRLATTIEGLQQQLDRIPTDTPLLAHRAAIQALVEQLAVVRNDRSRLRDHQVQKQLHRVLPEPDRLLAATQDTAHLQGIAAALAEEDRELARRAQAVESERARLGIVVSGGAVATLPVPSAETIEQARQGSNDRNRERQRLTRTLEDAQQELADAERRIGAAARGKAVPDAEQIDAARVTRDARWHAVKTWFVDDQPPEATGITRAMAAASVDSAMQAFDELVAAVLEDTERAAVVQSLRASIRDRQATAEAAGRRLLAIDEEGRAEAEHWQALWQSITTHVEPPDLMVRWRDDWRELTQAVTGYQTLEAGIRSRRAAVESGREQLLTALQANALTAAPEQGFVSLYQTALEQVQTHRDRLETEQQAAQALARMTLIQQEVRALLPLLGNTGGTDIQGDMDIEDGIRQLEEACESQRRAWDERQRISSEIVTCQSTRAQLTDDRMLRTNALEQIAADIGVDSADLEAVAERSRDIIELRRNLARIEQSLVEGGAGLSLGEIIDEAADAGSPDDIAARHQAIDGDLALLNAQHAERVAEHATEKQAWDRIQTGADAAELADEREQVLAEIERQTEETVLLMLAEALLQQAVEEARRQGESGLTGAAGAWFRELTDGAFSGLEVETHDDQVHAVTLRSDGGRLYPTGLSDGTLDQLWLAWRLAGIEHHLERIGQVPLIVDDVLVNFDDQRSAAAFHALARISERTQVIVLTHHGHLIDIATARLGADRVMVTSLDPRPDQAQTLPQTISAVDAIAPLPPDRPPERPGRLRPVRAADNAAGERLLDAMDGALRGKSELIERSGIDESDWNPSIRFLLETGRIEQQGERRGARYRRRSD